MLKLVCCYSQSTYWSVNIDLSMKKVLSNSVAVKVFVVICTMF